MRQYSRGYNASSLHPLPASQDAWHFRLRTHGSHLPLCDLNPCNMHSLPCSSVSPVSLGIVLSPHMQVVFASFSCLLGQVLPFVLDRMAPCPINPSLSVLGSDQAFCAWLVLSSPSGGGGVTTSFPKTKKNEDATVVSQPCLTRTAQSSCFITVDKIRFSKKCRATRCLFGQQLFAFSLLSNRFWFQKRSWCGPRFGHRFWYQFWAPHCFFA